MVGAENAGSSMAATRSTPFWGAESSSGSVPHTSFTKAFRSKDRNRYPGVKIPSESVRAEAREALEVAVKAAEGHEV